MQSGAVKLTKILFRRSFWRSSSSYILDFWLPFQFVVRIL